MAIMICDDHDVLVIHAHVSVIMNKLGCFENGCYIIVM